MSIRKNIKIVLSVSDPTNPFIFEPKSHKVILSQTIYTVLSFDNYEQIHFGLSVEKLFKSFSTFVDTVIIRPDVFSNMLPDSSDKIQSKTNRTQSPITALGYQGRKINYFNSL